MERVSKEWINRVPKEDDPYWSRVRDAAQALDSDGCTGVPDWHLDACYEHDIHWRTGCTLDGAAISQAQANTRFRKVIQSRSFLKVASPMSWWRYAGVSISGWFRKDKTCKDCPDA